MHGTGWFNMLIILTTGGSCVCVEGRSFDVVEMLDTIEREGVNAAAIVGDAFAKPVLRAIETEPNRWDLSSLVILSSSGVMWSEATKQGLLAQNPGMLLVDAFSSSEALGMGQSVSSAAGASKTAKFTLGENARVIDDAGKDVEPGSGQSGRVAVKGVTPVGYYKDEAKSAATFIELDGQRYSIPGDYATVAADGTLELLGRGSVCINTGGEKVYPEEVEEALKEHPSVLDAVAVGVPDDRFGEAITAVVEPADAGAGIDEAALIAHVKGKLAAYKAPKRVLTVETIGRAPNGKVDYRRLRGFAEEQLAGARSSSSS
jgi:fatty-acyl-CoA synthase